MKAGPEKFFVAVALLIGSHYSSNVFAQNLFVSDGASGNIYEYTPDGMRTTFASDLNEPQGLAFDSAGNLYVAELGSGKIYKYPATGPGTTFASVPNSPNGLAFDSAGDLFVANNGGSSIIEFLSNGTTNVFASGLSGVTGLAFDKNGNLFAAEPDSFVIDEFQTNGSRIVSGGISPYDTYNQYPAGLAMDGAGNAFVAAYGYIFSSGYGGVYEFMNALTAGEMPGSFIAPNSGLISPVGLAFDSAGNLYVADSGNGNTNVGAIYKYAPGGSRTTFATNISPNYIAFAAILAPVPFTYATNNGSITITGYTGSGGAVTVPTSINGLSVTSVGNNAFSPGYAGLTNLTSLVIPASVTNIGEYAFYFCSSLASITIPSSVTSIGGGAFAGCSSLTSATIPSSVTSLGEETFSDCSSLTNVVIGNGVTNLGSFAFSGCYDLIAANFLGNAPSPTNDTTVFDGDNLATGYYLQGTTGWGPIFDGIPTQMLLPPPALGISTYGSQPAVFFPTATGTNYVLQMTTNLGAGPWVTVSNGIPINGLVITNPPSNAFFRLH